MRVAFVDDISIDSQLRYMRGLIAGFRRIGFKNEITIYVRRDRQVESVPGAAVKKIWSQFRFPFQVVEYAIRDHQDVTHIQFDSPTFGIAYTPLLLPFLFLFLRISGKYASTTVHAVPSISSQSDMKTMNEMLKMRSIKIPPIFVKIGLLFTFTLIGFFSSQIIVHTPTLKRWLQFDYRISESKITVIPHGTDNPTIEDTAKTMPSFNLGGKKIVLFFGRINPRKGIELLLQAWSKIFFKFPEYVLVIAGTIYRYDISGQYFTSLKELSSRLGINDCVVFTGRLSEDQINWLYLKSEFVVLPYRFSNAASGPLAIAIGFGKPVIAFAIGTFVDEITNNVNGILVKHVDEVCLEEAINSMLCDGDLRSRLQRNARMMMRKHSWDYHAQMLLLIWCEHVKNLSLGCHPSRIM